MTRQFWEHQMKLINQYQTNVMEVMKERDNAIKETLLMRERMMLQTQLQVEHDKIKKSMGYLPFDNNTYYHNIEELFNNPKVNASQLNQNLTTFRSNNTQQNFPSNRSNNTNNNYGYRTNNNISNKLKESNNSNYGKGKSYSPVKQTIKHAQQEPDELAESCIYEQSGNYQCLEAESKLVKIKEHAADDEEQFYETWRDDETMNNISKLILNNQKSIVEKVVEKREEIQQKNEKISTKNQTNSGKNSSNTVINKSSYNPNKLNSSNSLVVKEPPQKDNSVISNKSGAEKEKEDNLSRSKASNKIIGNSQQTVPDKNKSMVVSNEREEDAENPENNYEESFDVIEEDIVDEEDKKGKKVEKKEEINLDEYKEIHEKDNEKFKTKVNFFESDNGTLLRPGANTTMNNRTVVAEKPGAPEPMEGCSVIGGGSKILM